MTLLLLLGSSGGTVTPPAPDYTPVPGEDFWLSGTELGEAFDGLEFDRPFRVGAVGNGRLLITGRIKRNGAGLDQIIWRCREDGDWRIGVGAVSPGDDFWFWTWGEGIAPWRSATRESSTLTNAWVHRSTSAPEYPGPPLNLSFPYAATVVDDFNRADTGPPPSSNWNNDPFNLALGHLKVTSNQLALTTSFASAGWTIATGRDCEAFYTVATVGGTNLIGIYARMTDMGTSAYDCYGFEWNTNGTYSIRRYNNGTPTVLKSGSAPIPLDGARTGIRCIGSRVEAWMDNDGAGWVRWAEVTDSSPLMNGGNAAIYIEHPASVIDNFAVGTIVTDAGTVWATTDHREVAVVASGSGVIPKASTWGGVWMDSPSWWWEPSNTTLYVNTGSGVAQTVADPADLIDNFDRADEASSSRWIESSRPNYYNLSVQSRRGAGSASGYVWARPASLGKFTDVIAMAEIAADFGDEDYLSVPFRADFDTETGYELGVYEYGSGLYGIEMYRYDNSALGAAYGFQTVSQWKAGDKVAVRAIGDQLEAWYYRAATSTWTLAFTATDGTYQDGHVGVGMTPNVRISEYRAHAVTEPPFDLQVVYDAVYETGNNYELEVAVVPAGGSVATVSGLQHMTWRTEVVNSVDHMIDQSAPSVLAPGTNMQALYTALAKGVGDLAAAAEDAAYQTLPELATWAVPIWEEQVGIPPNNRIPLDKRVAAVMARLTTRGGTRGSFFDLVDEIVGTGSLVTDIYDSYRVNIRLSLVNQILRERAEELIKEIKPLGINVVVSYGSFIAGISVAGDSL